MTLPLTWDQMPLTTAQQAAVQSLIAWANAGDGSTPPLTYSQIKALRLWFASLHALTDSGRVAMSAAYNFWQAQAVATFDAANP